MNNGRRVIADLAVVAYFFVAGAIITAMPWTGLWPPAVSGAPWLSAIVSNPLLRGAVSGFGLVLISSAVLETLHAVKRKPR